MGRILIIDDDAAVRRVLGAMLENDGHVVMSAPDGAAGTALFDRNVIDVVITDIIMPDQEGIGTILALKKRRPGLPIIAISGGGRISPREHLETAEDLGVFRTFSKPLERATLLAAVKEALSD